MMKVVAVLFGLAACATGVPVKLRKVTMQVVERDGKKFQDVSAETVLENIAFRKEVYLHFTNVHGVERHLPFRWSHMIEGNEREVWKLSTVSTELVGGEEGEGDADGADGADGEGKKCRVAVDYKVNGQTFCDMDEGEGYFFDCNGGEAIVPAILVDESVPPPIVEEDGTIVPALEPGTFAVRAALRNIAFVKHVHVYYTTDNWETSEAGKLTYGTGPNEQGTEHWWFVTTLPSGSEVQYWVYYAAGKKGYTDNNYGTMYTTTIL